jgi:hypothetical protein
MLPTPHFEFLLAKMKVHPAIFMKTKERSNLNASNVWKDACGLEVQTQRPSGGVLILTPGPNLRVLS